MSIRAGNTREFSVPSAHSCCEYETGLKIKGFPDDSDGENLYIILESGF